jgi:hypothetical protein
MEMHDLAVDMHEETYEKKYKAARLAYEAQLYVLERFNKTKNVVTIDSPYKSSILPESPKAEEIIPTDSLPPPMEPPNVPLIQRDSFFDDPMMDMPLAP